MNDIIGSALRQLAAAAIAAIVTGVLHWMLSNPAGHVPHRDAATVPMVLHVPLQQTL
jgi:hypothetical protein